MSRILGVGIATLDIINHLASYPAEDDEVRALAQRIVRGGNATNTLTVLSRLGHDCAWAGVWVNEPNGHRIHAELAADNIDTRYCQRLEQGYMPVSYVNHSAATGSRTIVHYRDLPEFSFADFQRVQPSKFDWIHFEGRHIDETRRMLSSLTNYAGTISLEIEKPRPDIESLWAYPDVLLFGKQFVRAQGRHAEQFLPNLQRHWPDKKLFCAWGADGAYAIADGDLIHHPAVAPTQLVDTLGAGDTFNAGVIHALSRGATVADALAFSCQLAGFKCGVMGLPSAPLPFK